MEASEQEEPVPPGEDPGRFPDERDDGEAGAGDATPAEDGQEHEDPATGDEAPTG